MQKRLSLIILGTIFISFALLLVISVFSIRHFGMKNAEEKAEIIAELVQNGLTAHMMSNTMDQREFFLKKIAPSPAEFQKVAEKVGFRVGKPPKNGWTTL